jgi:hypothetical protein
MGTAVPAGALNHIYVPVQVRYLRNGMLVGRRSMGGTFMVVNGAARATSWPQTRPNDQVCGERMPRNGWPSPYDIINKYLGRYGCLDDRTEADELRVWCDIALAMAKMQVRAHQSDELQKVMSHLPLYGHRCITGLSFKARKS